MPPPNGASEDTQDWNSTTMSRQARASSTPTGCRLTKPAVLAAAFSVTVAVFLPATALYLAASLVRLRYCCFSRRL